jgi:radical SAM superfamily enzyme with C-terminal helix-hairpin-helix motif
VKVVNEVAGWRPEDDEAPFDPGAPGVQPADRDGGAHAPGSDLEAPTFGDDAPRRLPKLLPGINLLHGLKGEREETFEHNEAFLQRVYDEGLILRRVNIRQVMAFPGTDMDETGAQIANDHKQLFKQYKTRVREQIDNPMLQRVAPPGTVLPNVTLEYHEGGRTFGRQLGTYPLLVGIPGERELGKTIDVAIVDHGYRSVTGVPFPLDLNAASMNELAALPGIGKQRAGDIVVNRPYDSVADLGVDADLSAFVTAGSPAGAD